ncbi:hypothetical protein ASD38_04810 [Caulobacter sp. Root487D2Y]|uniref:hypothetical protein n=1 Tax=Caulobacter sp. Root487D2Y TaxID=1736547 RepID=UPI0006F2E335|nr:hypothetical protein [Caulobacter sp. Root487D2Y]KQY35868.1 hypothetical protein ASD38_04810 [Caulobacter sp. Root487D2Y]
MSESAWEDALETVVAVLEAPPPPDSQEGQVIDEPSRRVLAAAPSTRWRAVVNPFGDHPDGIGQALGMDLGRTSRMESFVRRSYATTADD